jgi:hypothetical protein
MAYSGARHAVTNARELPGESGAITPKIGGASMPTIDTRIGLENFRNISLKRERGADVLTDGVTGLVQ